jgi:hypothetical protein
MALIVGRGPIDATKPGAMGVKELLTGDRRISVRLVGVRRRVDVEPEIICA